MGKAAAQGCLNVFVQSTTFVAHLKCELAIPMSLLTSDATREPLVAVCFAAVYLLRMCVNRLGSR